MKETLLKYPALVFVGFFGMLFLGMYIEKQKANKE